MSIWLIHSNVSVGRAGLEICVIKVSDSFHFGHIES